MLLLFLAFCIMFNVGVMSNDLTNEIKCKFKNVNVKYKGQTKVL